MTRQDRSTRGYRTPNAARTVAAVAGLLLVLLLVTSRWGDSPEPVGVALDTIGTPILQLDRDFVDFGDVQFNQMVEATFEVTNTGDATLLFTEEPFIELEDGC
ncbi:MAG TPA: hypothetical protein VLT15_13260 [Acidimicrobiia bacterium]|nr:hypothetical protein [Acidimicrobiia bacterium]